MQNKDKTATYVTLIEKKTSLQCREVLSNYLCLCMSRVTRQSTQEGVYVAKLKYSKNKALVLESGLGIAGQTNLYKSARGPSFRPVHVMDSP